MEDQLQLIHEEDGGSIPTSPLQYKIIEIEKNMAKAVYGKHHYLGEKDFMHIRSFGALYDGIVWGAITFGLPNAKEINGIYTKDTQHGVYEIVRLAFDDRCVKNSESRLIGVSIRLLKKIEYVKTILSYADTKQNHEGTIYKATNFEYRGLTAKKTDFKMSDGKIRKMKGVKYSQLSGEWVERSQKHLYVMTI